MMSFRTAHLFALLPLGLTLALSACAPGDVKEALTDQRPKVSVADQRLTSLDFKQVKLAFDIQVDNPNPFGLELAGLDYDLKLAGHSFASGNQDKHMQLAASGPSHFELPLSMAFAEIYQGLKGLKGKSEVPYELTTGLMIDVPLLGKLRYPVTAKGLLPLPQLPKVKLQNLTLEKLNYTSANLALKLQVDNPNAFSLGLDRLRYDLTVNGKRWASADQASLGSVQQQQQNTITLPLTLHFMELGTSVYNLLSSGQKLDYRLNGTLDASSSNSLIGKFDMPFNNRGQISLSK